MVTDDRKFDTRLGAYTTIFAALLMITGAVLKVISGADLDQALTTGSLSNYLTKVEEVRHLLVANLSFWIIGVFFLGIAGIPLADLCNTKKEIGRIIERTKTVFDESIYGIIGDLHYPVPDGRINILGLNMQRLLASGEGPLTPLTYEEVKKHIELLQSLDIGIIGVGGHDSSDQVSEEFSNTFSSKYKYIKVGSWIEVESSDNS